VPLDKLDIAAKPDSASVAPQGIHVSGLVSVPSRRVRELCEVHAIALLKWLGLQLGEITEHNREDPDFDYSSQNFVTEGR